MQRIIYINNFVDYLKDSGKYSISYVTKDSSVPFKLSVKEKIFVNSQAVDVWRAGRIGLQDFS